MSEQPPASPPPPPPGFPPPPGPPPGPPPLGPPSFGSPSYGPPPAAKPKRARVVLAAVAAVVVLAAAVVVPLVVLGDEDEPDRAGESGAASTEDAQEEAGDDLADVVTYDDLPTTHVDDPVDYDQVPPVGGAHFDQWLDCGVYDAPVPDENAVHDLEHGTVWITYDPDLGEDDVAALEDELPQNGIMSPYDGLPAPVVVTVWGTQLELTGADDPRLPLFVREYSGGVTAPEPMASCAGGTADPAGGAVGA